MPTLTIKKELEITDLDRLLWSGAAARWANATDEQRERVWETLIDLFANRDALPDMTAINDFIWFECDDLLEDE